jgi:D-arginine utilization repressor
MRPELQQILPIAEAIERLFHPYIEVVLHDLATQTIAAIWNNFSERQVGDDSLLDSGELDRIDFNRTDFDQTVIGPYLKTNWDGRPLKSISAVLRHDGRWVGLLCLNVDLSQFEAVKTLLTQFVQPANLISQPEALFKDDWQERINLYVLEHLRGRQQRLETLSRDDKRQLVRLLNQKGAFSQKNAAAYVGRVLGISRATVYNYLSD